MTDSALETLRQLLSETRPAWYNMDGEHTRIGGTFHWSSMTEDTWLDYIEKYKELESENNEGS